MGIGKTSFLFHVDRQSITHPPDLSVGALESGWGGMILFLYIFLQSSAQPAQLLHNLYTGRSKATVCDTPPAQPLYY